MRFTALAVVILAIGIVAGFALAGGASEEPVSASHSPGNLVPLQIDRLGPCFDSNQNPIFTSMCPIEGVLDLQAPGNFCSDSPGGGDVFDLIVNSAPGICLINSEPDCDPNKDGPWYNCVAVQTASSKAVIDGVNARASADGACDLTALAGNHDGVDDFFEAVNLVFGSGTTGIYEARDCDLVTPGKQMSSRIVSLIVLEDPPTLSAPAGYPILAIASFYLSGCAIGGAVVVNEDDLDRYCGPSFPEPGRAVVYGRFVNIIFTDIGDADSDGDGIPDALDACPGTASGAKVDSAGCPTPEMLLAERFSPRLFIWGESPLDADADLYDPKPVEIFFDDSTTFRDRRFRPIDCGPEIDADCLREHRQEGNFLDLPGEVAEDLKLGTEIQYRVLKDDFPNTAYARVVEIRDKGGEKRVVLQYWFLYYFNDWNNNHEGDWEMIQLVFEADSVLQILAESRDPVMASYSCHASGNSKPWADVDRDESHPNVYVATGSHANYFSAGTKFNPPECVAFGIDSAPDETEARILERPTTLEIRLLTEDAQDDPWLLFRGRWGQVVDPPCDAFDLLDSEVCGPTGPMMKDQWSDPLAWP